MESKDYIRCGALLHGHSCPPLVLGIRAGAVAMSKLGIGRAKARELFAMVELGGDHYAQGFADGVQLVTGCTYGKDLIVRIPHGKLGLRLVDQARGRAIRVAARLEALTWLERTPWFRTCESSGTSSVEMPELSEPVIEELLAVPEEELFSVGMVFPLKLSDPAPKFDSAVCEACGESVLSSYAREVDGRRFCIPCEERFRTRSVR